LWHIIILELCHWQFMLVHVLLCLQFRAWTWVRNVFSTVTDHIIPCIM
jgi:hypothetical protein